MNPRTGTVVNTLEVPSATAGDHLVTSFSSKSELALNRSTDGKYVTFMGYVAPIDALDVSNSNTPRVVDSTNPVGENYYRAVAQVDKYGNLQFTMTNAYSGNNGRAAILNDMHGFNSIFMAGNAGNGNNPQPDGVIGGAGAQIMTPALGSEGSQAPGNPTPVGSFNINQLPAYSTVKDKAGKDTNFRGLTIFNNVVYLTKGSGGNGLNTVYFIDTTGSACPDGVGLPAPFAVLPTTGIDPSYDYTKSGIPVTPYNMCVLNGFPTVRAKLGVGPYPFGLWFANANTLYVADEGSGDNTYSSGTETYTNAAAQTTAGLQKWVFNSITGSWHYAYTLYTGLDLGTPYTVTGYPTGINPAPPSGTGTGLPWAPATDGLRNITGRVNDDGTVTVWAITSTVSGSGDQGADPNKLVMVTDSLANTDPSVAATESFSTVLSAGFAEVLRGVSPTPGSNSGSGE